MTNTTTTKRTARIITPASPAFAIVLPFMNCVYSVTKSSGTRETMLIIDDTVGNTLVSASTLQKEVKAELEKTNDVEAAAYLGKVIAERAKAKGIDEVVFDRGGFIYQGKIKALADAAREAGLNF